MDQIVKEFHDMSNFIRFMKDIDERVVMIERKMLVIEKFIEEHNSRHKEPGTRKCEGILNIRHAGGRME